MVLIYDKNFFTVSVFHCYLQPFFILILLALVLRLMMQFLNLVAYYFTVQ